MTHSALLSRSFGSPSGMSISSLNTWPQASNRFCSRLSLVAKVGHARKMAMTKTLTFLMIRLLDILLDSCWTASPKSASSAGVIAETGRSVTTCLIHFKVENINDDVSSVVQQNNVATHLDVHAVRGWRRQTSFQFR